jgi:hypothetical protein
MNYVKRGRLLGLLVACVAPFLLRAQTVYEPTYRDVYNFLTRLGNKGIVVFNDQIRPVSRWYIESLLAEAAGKQDQLTGLERQELRFFSKEYYHERLLRADTVLTETQSRWLRRDDAGRFRLYSYTDQTFKVQVNPIAGVAPNARDGSFNYHQWAGVYLHGYLGKYLGFSFDYREHYEKGQTIDRTRQFTPQPGIILLTNEGPISYGSVNATLGTAWKWGSAAIGKDKLQWGYGEGGKLVLSDKSPSFPFLRLDLQPAKWLRFNYLHAFLNSRQVDSSAMYPTTLTTSKGPVYRTPLRPKYLVSHTVTFLPSPKWSLMMGESVVYSDKFQPAYLVPFLFFRPADFDNSGGNDGAASNSQFFFGFNARNVLRKTQLYGTLFIDEIKLRSLFDPQHRRNQIGYTLGISTVDLPLRHLTATVEYTRINPFVYDNYIPTQVYQNNGYNLGHWMGNNADQLYFSLNYRFLRGLQARVYYAGIRKADLVDTAWQYDGRHRSPDFLFGKNRRNYTQFGGEVRYEITHDLFARLDYFSQQEYRLETGTTRRLTQATFGLNYGF